MAKAKADVTLTVSSVQQAKALSRINHKTGEIGRCTQWHPATIIH